MSGLGKLDPPPADEHNERNQADKKNTQQPEDVVETEHSRLFLQQPVKHFQGTLVGRGAFEAAPLQKLLDLRLRLLQFEIINRETLSQMVLVELGPTGKDGSDKGYPEAAPQVPQQVEDGAPVPHFRFGEAG